MPYVIPARRSVRMPLRQIVRRVVRRKPARRPGRRSRRYGPGGAFSHPKWDVKLRKKLNRPFLIPKKVASGLPPPRKNTRGEFVLPPELRNAWAISIRPPKFRALQRRMGPWKKHVKLFPGTVGIKDPSSKISAGQQGCYDSHVRMWRKVAQTKGTAFIMEDDVALFYNEQVARRLNYLFQQIRRNRVNFDILYIFHSTSEKAGRKVCPGVSTAVPWDGLFGYVLKASGARKLLKNAMPAQMAVDMYVANEIAKGRVRGMRSVPSMGFVVPGKSDTINLSK